MRRCVTVKSVVAAVVCLCGVSAVAPGQLPDVGNLAEVVTGLSAPIYAAADPTDNSRVFVVEQTGRVRVVVNGVLQAAPFVDVSAVLPPNSGTITIGGTVYTIVRGSEQGLLGLAFAPDYATSGTIYINLTARRYDAIPGVPAAADYSWGCSGATCTFNDRGRTLICKIQRSAGNPLVSTTPTITTLGQLDSIMQYDQPYNNHNGGNLQYGPDGLLYIGTGDGGSGNDPGNRALDRNNILGKMLRIDPSGDDFPADASRDYRIPAGNPFSAGGGLAEIWAVGLRNPWRYSFDRATGDLWIADVGQNVWEEVNVVPGNGGPGRNYGWRVREGLVGTGLSAGPHSVANLTDPVYVYDHGTGTTQGFSITGGYVYRGTAIPSWRGRYFFSDYVTDRIWSARMINGVWSDFQDLTTKLSNLGTTATLMIRDVSSFGEDNNGELFIVQLNGRIRKLVPQGVQPCRADLDNGQGLGHPDFAVTIEDLLFYLPLFENGDLRGDLDNGSGNGVFDNAVTIEDLLYMLVRFEAGC
jgi:glucose/arabinose dehydrogenase